MVLYSIDILSTDRSSCWVFLCRKRSMSFMKGDLLTRTRKVVKGLAKAEPVWLKAANFPRVVNGKMERISLPENDDYVKKLFQKQHPDSKYGIKINGRVFGWQVLELMEQGVSGEQAMVVADSEYRSEKKAKKKAYSRLKRIARLQGTRPPPFMIVRDRFYDPKKILKIVKNMKEEKNAEAQANRMTASGGRCQRSSINGSGAPGSSLMMVIFIWLVLSYTLVEAIESSPETEEEPRSDPGRRRKFLIWFVVLVACITIGVVAFFLFWYTRRAQAAAAATAAALAPAAPVVVAPPRLEVEQFPLSSYSMEGGVPLSESLCMVCHEDFVEGLSLRSCRHFLHDHCARDIFAVGHDTCPLCRADLRV